MTDKVGGQQVCVCVCDSDTVRSVDMICHIRMLLLSSYNYSLSHNGLEEFNSSAVCDGEWWWWSEQ